MRILSGIQPSGALHIGNYLGAIQQYIALQHDNEAYYFVADYHALTSVREPDRLRGYVRDVLLDLLALGLEPDKATLFVQSDVPETIELAWLLTSVTPMGWLEKCVSYKDKIAQGIPAEHGLFAYPVLQAADILLYDADVVPVGQDQKQHLEITRDIAERFNGTYGKNEPVFKLPNEKILPSVAVVPGLDGRKMSKSYGNSIEIFEDPKSIEKKCKRIVTDSIPVEEPKNPETCSVYNLLKLFVDEQESADWAARYRAGGMGYGEVKKRLAQAIIDYFAPYRDARQALAADPVRLEEIRRAGAEKARKTARIVLERARDACGLGS
jgi:tryptophanyl-tRNA synthetase